MCVCLYALLWSHGCVSWRLELREQIKGVDSLFLPYGLQGSTEVIRTIIFPCWVTLPAPEVFQTKATLGFVEL